MHAAIEFAKKKTEIYVPHMWKNVIRMARKKNPYMIVPLTYEDIYDFKALQKQALRYRKEDTEGEKINWLQIRWLRFEKCDPDYISFKYSCDDEFKEMRVTENTKKGRPAANVTEIPKRYKSKQSISSAKKKDLLNLCKNGVIPHEYHEFYKGLPADKKVPDTLPDPDVEEDERDSSKE